MWFLNMKREITFFSTNEKFIKLVYFTFLWCRVLPLEKLSWLFAYSYLSFRHFRGPHIVIHCFIKFFLNFCCCCSTVYHSHCPLYFSTVVSNCSLSEHPAPFSGDLCLNYISISCFSLTWPFTLTVRWLSLFHRCFQFSFLCTFKPLISCLCLGFSFSSFFSG